MVASAQGYAKGFIFQGYLEDVEAPFRAVLECSSWGNKDFGGGEFGQEDLYGPSVGSLG